MSDDPPEYPPPPPPPDQPQPAAVQIAPRNGLGIAALILGIIGAISGIIPLFFWLAGILGVIGLILGFAGRGRVKRGEATNGTAALWGIITSAIAVVLSIVGVVILVGAFEQADDDLSGIESPAPAPETTSSPAPEEEPAATEEPPAPEPEPEVAAESFSGTGSQVVTLANPDTEPVRIVQFTAEQSEGNTVVWGVDESAADVALLVNTIGAYTGTRLINEGFQSQGVVAFKVEAAGPWSMTVSPISSARRWDGAAPLTGEGDDVVIVADGLQPGIAPVTFAHEGDGNFAVWAYGDESALLVNEVGAYTGETLVPAGTVVVDVTANGPWSMTQG